MVVVVACGVRKAYIITRELKPSTETEVGGTSKFGVANPPICLDHTSTPSRLSIVDDTHIEFIPPLAMIPVVNSGLALASVRTK